MMHHELTIAGFGGQGILFAGKVIAHAAMDIGMNISWLPSYGPEMRGGTANCQVVLSDEPIGSPIITKPETLMVMNLPSLDKFEQTVKTGGTILLDSFYIDKKVEREDVTAIYIPAKRIAEEVGDGRLGNMVMVGHFIRRFEEIPLEEIEQSMRRNISKSKADLAEINIKMLEAGYNFKG